MWLEDGRNLTVLIQLTNAARTLQNLLWMVGVVAEEYQLVCLDFKVEATFYATVRHKTNTQLLSSTSC